jgi:AMP-binding enzyme
MLGRPGVTYGGVHRDGPLPPAVPLESLLEATATTRPDRTAIDFYDRTAIDFYDRTFTYRELHDLAARAAKGQQTLGVEPGVHVGLHLSNTPHFVICFFAVLNGRRAGRLFQSVGGTAGAQVSAHRLRDRGHDHGRLADALPADRGLEGRREIPDAGSTAASRTFCWAPLARAFGSAADRDGAAGREIEFASRSITTARSSATRTSHSRTRSRCSNTPAVRRVSPRGRCSLTPT